MKREFPPEVIADIKAHAELFPKEEVCGLILCDRIDGEDSYTAISGDNVHPDPAHYFEMDEDTFSALSLRISMGAETIVYHTHLEPEEVYFSPEDAASIAEQLVPNLLYHVPTGYVSYWDPTLERPYEERDWNYVFDNCYTLVREWLRREMGIHMDHFQLKQEEEWNLPGWSRFEDGLPTQGFTRVIEGIPRFDVPEHELKRGDLITMSIGNLLSTHIAVMVDVAGNQILHHMADHVSGFAPYGSRYRDATTGVWRHGSQL